MKARIFAGPNGSGKSTLIYSMEKGMKLNMGFIINADNIENELNTKKAYGFSKELVINTIQLQSLKENKRSMALLLLCFVCLFSRAQNDTIFRNDGRLIPCEITLVNENAIFFKDKKGTGDQLEFKNITQYSKNGVLTRVNVPADTVYNALFVDNVNINKLDIKFCELVNLDVGFTGGNAYIYIDYGQFIENAQKITIRNNKGTAVYFNSIVGALNFMEKNGWEYVNQSSSTNGIALGKTATIYKILLKRKL